ncbi:SH3 domain-containing protein [Streptomyces sp. NPDC048664]|uniref:SH3 domain-containing protein n=1 Tax=Streptomyces sp. NPDC048664 TaxID=3154505 RepID=UPI00342541E3
MSVDRAGQAAVGTGSGSGAEPGNATEAASAVRSYPVAPGIQLKVRSGPGTGYAVVRTLPEGAWIPILCQTTGTLVAGTYGTSAIWDRTAAGEYVADAYVNTGSDGWVASRCG